jgi:uncharacterized alpha-E superfamily protein
MYNAESVQDSLSPEAWAALIELRSRFQRSRYKEGLSETDAARVTRRLCESASQLIPQFFAVANDTMLADDGWRFCEIGQSIERATITANSLASISKTLAGHPGPSAVHPIEIELSAFLRLLGCRDAYRRIFQMRAEPIAVLELLWQHPQVPRSVLRCITKCGALLRESIAPDMLETASAPKAIDAFIHEIRRIDWPAFVRAAGDEDQPQAMVAAASLARSHELDPLLQRLISRTFEIHTLVADGFLNHQARIAQVAQPLLRGF